MPVPPVQMEEPHGPGTGPVDGSRYAEALAKLFALRSGGIKLDLQRIRQAARALGDPHLRYPSFHIAGTNGKGSTAALLERMLRAHGYVTGLYTSPHLHRFTERVRIRGREISQDMLADLLPWILGRFPDLSFFEVATLLAFDVFRRFSVDVAVIEVGLGGRLDATNILRLPLATAITSIGLDHEHILGANRMAIAREKASIFKPGRPAIVSLGQGGTEAERAAAIRVISQMAEQVGAPLRLAGRDFGAIPVPAPGHGFRYFGPGSPGGIQAASLSRGAVQRPSLGDRWIERLGLEGRHQLDNAAVALAMLGSVETELPVSESAILEGLAEASWPARLEMLTLPDEGGGEKRFLLDGAHNPQGAQALALHLSTLEPAPSTFIFGVLDDKDAMAMLAPLLPHIQRLLLVAPPGSRARAPEHLEGEVRTRFASFPRLEVQVAKSIAHALEMASSGDGGGPTVVTGSLYLVGQARALLTGEVEDAQALTDPVHLADLVDVAAVRPGLGTGLVANRGADSAGTRSERADAHTPDASAPLP